VVACGPARDQPPAQEDARGEEIGRAEAEAYNSLSKLDEYEVGTATYELFRQ
jgi:hypothetical protein